MNRSHDALQAICTYALTSQQEAQNQGGILHHL